MKFNKKIIIVFVILDLFIALIVISNNKPVSISTNKINSEKNEITYVKTADPSYQLMITDTDNLVIPFTPDIDIDTVEVDDNATDVLFRLNVTGSINILCFYYIYLAFDQDGLDIHQLSMEDGSFLWDSTSLPKSYYSGRSLIFIVPKTLETDSTFNISAFTINFLTEDYDWAPGDGGQWSDLYTWQVGTGVGGVPVGGGDGGGDGDNDIDSDEISLGWFTIDTTTAIILVGVAVASAIIIPTVIYLLTRPLEEQIKDGTQRVTRRIIRRKIIKKIKKKLKQRKIVFIDLIYPPVAIKNEPFNLYCFLGQRFSKNITIDFNVLRLVDEKKKEKEKVFESGQVVKLESLKPKILSFQVFTEKTTTFSFKTVVTAIKDKELKKGFEAMSDIFEVKVISSDIKIADINKSKTILDLEMLYQTIDDEEKELSTEFQEFASKFNVESLDQLKEKISIAKDFKKILDIEKESEEKIKFLVENISNIQDLSVSELDIIRDEILGLIEQIFILSRTKLKIIIPEEFESSEDIKLLAKAWILYKSIILKRLQKLEILKVNYEIRRKWLERSKTTKKTTSKNTKKKPSNSTKKKTSKNTSK